MFCKLQLRFAVPTASKQTTSFVAPFDCLLDLTRPPPTFKRLACVAQARTARRGCLTSGQYEGTPDFDSPRNHHPR